MYNLVIAFFLLAGCQGPFEEIKANIYNSETIKLDAVEKKIIISNNFSNEIKRMATLWADKYIKVNGFDGIAIINFKSYKESISNIDNGKKINIDLNLSVIIENNDNSKKIYKFDINEFSKIQGDFSLNEFDQLVKNTRLNLFHSLSKMINSEL